MLSLFSVSMPRAGHHVTEMVLGRLLAPRFEYCEFYTVRGCCRSIPCARIPARAATGAILFLQKSHDHDLSDPLGQGFDGTIVQVREPVARALSNYELDLETVGPQHTAAYQRWWLGLEAAYTIGFIRKWCTPKDPKILVLRYEQLVAEPIAYYRQIFDRFKLPADRFDPGRITGAQSVSSADKKPFRERDIRSSRYFDVDGLSDFQRLIVKDSTALGYPANPALTGGAKSRAVTLACAVRTRVLARDTAGAMAALETYLALPDAHVFARRLRGQLLLAAGDTKGAEREFAAVVEGEPEHARAYLDLAELQRRRGEMPAARATIERALAAARDPGRAAEWVLAGFPDPEIIALAKQFAPKPAVSREDVVAAFRFILGREPEGDQVIESHQAVGSAGELRAILLRSTEFAEKYRKLVATAGGG